MKIIFFIISFGVWSVEISPENDCAICLEKLGENSKVLPCEHAFHQECLKRDLERFDNDIYRYSCSLCRRPTIAQPSLNVCSNIVARNTQMFNARNGDIENFYMGTLNIGLGIFVSHEIFKFLNLGIPLWTTAIAGGGILTALLLNHEGFFKKEKGQNFMENLPEIKDLR